MSTITRIRIVELLALSALLIGTVQAEESRGGHKQDRKARMMKRFDADGDGKLSESERAAAKEAGKKHRDEMVKRHDTDGDGKLSETERAAAKEGRKARREGRRAKMMQKFDADGDGRLDKAEREARRKAHQERKANNADE